MPTTVALASKKGGVGKTTLSTSLASVAAAKGIRTVLIDLDPEGHATLGLGGDVTKAGSQRLLLPANTPAEFQEVAPNLSVVAGNYGLEDPELARLDPEALRDAIEALPHELVVIDCPPTSNGQRLLVMGRVASDAVLIPVNAHPFAIESALRLEADVRERMIRKRPGPSRYAVVANMVDTRRSLDNQVVAALKVQFEGVPHFSVRQDVNLAKATTSREPIGKDGEDFPSKSDLEKILRWVLKK